MNVWGNWRAKYAWKGARLVGAEYAMQTCQLYVFIIV